MAVTHSLQHGHIYLSLEVLQTNAKNLTEILTTLILAFREKVNVVPPTPVKGFETNSNTASAGYRKRLVNTTFTLIWPLLRKQKKICCKKCMPKAGSMTEFYIPDTDVYLPGEITN